MIELGFAEARDIGGWIALVAGMRDAFSGLESNAAMIDHQRSVLSFMARQEAVCAREDGNIVGCLLFSREKICRAFWPWIANVAGAALPEKWWNAYWRSYRAAACA